MTEDEQVLSREGEPAGDRSPYAIFATIGLVAAVVILMLVFWRSCSADSADEATSAGRTIEAVGGLETVPGVVSVWVRPESSIDEVLDRNGLSGTTASDMGEGTYVIDIGDLESEQVVKDLADDPGLYDAGYLFEDE